MGTFSNISIIEFNTEIGKKFFKFDFREKITSFACLMGSWLY